jgi:hypothetical protein
VKAILDKWSRLPLSNVSRFLSGAALRLHLSVTACGNDNVRAFGGQRTSDPFADSLTGPGYERELALQFEVHSWAIPSIRFYLSCFFSAYSICDPHFMLRVRYATLEIVAPLCPITSLDRLELTTARNLRHSLCI